MHKPLIAATLAIATLAGAAYAQQATTGQNQSNPRVNEQNGPVGTTPPGTASDRKSNNMSAGTPAPAASAPATGDTMRRNDRPARADRN